MTTEITNMKYLMKKWLLLRKTMTTTNIYSNKLYLENTKFLNKSDTNTYNRLQGAIAL